MQKLTHTLTVIVGDTGEYLSVAAQQVDSAAFLLEYNNVAEFFENGLITNTTVYTSLGDLTTEVFYNLLLVADKIIYIPPAVWSDQKTVDLLDPTTSTQGLTEHLLLSLPESIVVENIELCYLNPTVIPLVANRQSNDSQLWVCGCSVTHGTGVKHNETYGYILGNNLNIPTSFITRPGSSITWAADQILRSDVRKDDIVVWGITGNERLTVVANNQLLPGVNIKTFDIYPEIAKIISIDNLVSQNTFYENIYAIERVINYCIKIEAKLMLFGVLVSANMLRWLRKKSNFVNPFEQKIKITPHEIINETLDLGSDGVHPGPMQHQFYADFCQTSLKKLNYI